MATLGRFGNMNPPALARKSPYLTSVDPFKIIGNLYYVGNAFCSTHLIDTGDGLIILDVPAVADLPYLVNSIWRAGFDPRDIKYILISHAHADQYGSVKAMVHLTGAKTMMGELDVKDMKENPGPFEEMHRNFGGMEEFFEADVALKDGDIIELGNTKIRCALIPGHTIGTMAHFWDVVDNGKTYHVGIYGGAGFITLSDEWIAKNGLPASIKDTFVQSIDKVWNEKVDVMLGNHPFHNDTMKKRNLLLSGDKNAFIDPTEWQRFLQELKDTFAAFRKMTPDEIKKANDVSGFVEYTGRYIGLTE